MTAWILQISALDLNELNLNETFTALYEKALKKVKIHTNTSDTRAIL